MLSIDLTLNSATAITAGTANSRVASITNSGENMALRSVASLATTNPEQLKISHSTRTIKGLRSAANAALTGQDVVFDRHLIRFDKNVVQTKVLDPEQRVNRSVQIVIEVPRLAGETPTSTNVGDDLLSIVSMLNASSWANLVRVLNWES
jgi:hypothetical protein